MTRTRFVPLAAVGGAHLLVAASLWQAGERAPAPTASPERRLVVALLMEPRPDPPPTARPAPPPAAAAPRRARPAAVAPAPIAPTPIEPPSAVERAPVAVALEHDPMPPREAAAEMPTPPVPEQAPSPPREVDASAVRYRTPPSPDYPMLSLRQQEAGTVLLRILVGESGEPREATIVRSSGYRRLDQAALDAMRRARFEPYVEDGVARAVWVVAPIRFALDRS